MSRWRQGLEVLEDVLWPPRCVSCSANLASGGLLLCHSCREGLEWIEDRFCKRCGLPADRGEPLVTENWFCRPCQYRPWQFSFARSALHHQGTARELVHRWKLQRDEKLGPVLGRLLGELDEERLLPWIEQGAWVVPVPLGLSRRTWRGFDQAQELARALARQRGLRFQPALRRARKRGRQIERSGLERSKDWEGVFQVRRRLRTGLARQPVILVDDVMTTGSTVNAAAAALRLAGCPDVMVVTLTRET